MSAIFSLRRGLQGPHHGSKSRKTLLGTTACLLNGTPTTLGNPLLLLRCRLYGRFSLKVIPKSVLQFPLPVKVIDMPSVAEATHQTAGLDPGLLLNFTSSTPAQTLAHLPTSLWEIPPAVSEDHQYFVLRGCYDPSGSRYMLKLRSEASKKFVSLLPYNQNSVVSFKKSEYLRSRKLLLSLVESQIGLKIAFLKGLTAHQVEFFTRIRDGIVCHNK